MVGSGFSVPASLLPQHGAGRTNSVVLALCLSEPLSLPDCTALPLARLFIFTAVFLTQSFILSAFFPAEWFILLPFPLHNCPLIPQYSMQGCSSYRTQRWCNTKDECRDLNASYARTNATRKRCKTVIRISPFDVCHGGNIVLRNKRSV